MKTGNEDKTEISVFVNVEITNTSVGEMHPDSNMYV